jgi:glycosyltransferase (activator-dependent family)
MRVLITVIPERTTFLHMVPLAWALRASGHQVVVASAPSFTDTITRAGLTAVPVGRDASIWRVEELDPDKREEGRDGLPTPWDVVVQPEQVGWLDQLYGHHTAVEQGHKPENFPIIAGTVEFARSWQPDLVLWDPLSYCGAIAATACGAAHARVLWSVDVLGATREHYLRLMHEQPADERADPLAEWLTSYGRKYGYEFSEDLVTGDFTIDQMPPSLRMTATGLNYVPIRYTPYGGPAVVPKWLQEKPKRLRVGFTLGTTATERFAGYTFSVADALAALSDVDAEIVATIAESEQDKLGRVPDNVRLVPYTPLDALAASCTAMINHCGPGTFLTTACHGVPQLHVPWDFDEPELARRSAAFGGSTTLHGQTVTGETIRAGLVQLLEEESYRSRAQALREEITAMPTPREVVVQLAELTRQHREEAA